MCILANGAQHQIPLLFFFFFFLLKRENEIQGLFGGEVEEGQRRSKDAWKFEPSVG